MCLPKRKTGDSFVALATSLTKDLVYKVSLLFLDCDEHKMPRKQKGLAYWVLSIATAMQHAGIQYTKIYYRH